jgi:hypothetical protein
MSITKLEAAARRFVDARRAYFNYPTLALVKAVADAADALAAALPPLVVRGTAHNCPRCADAMECECPTVIIVGPLEGQGMARLRGLLDRPGAEL